jgi:hypothetical protein
VGINGAEAPIPFAVPFPQVFAFSFFSGADALLAGTFHRNPGVASVML